MQTIAYPATWERVTIPGGVGNTLEYVKTTEGTCYRVGTPIEVIRFLESARCSGSTVRVFYGDTETGRDWGEEYDTIGTVGRSMGPCKVPLLMRSSRSIGGGEILTACIVRITIDKRDAYRHPTYHAEALEVRPATLPDYAEGVYNDKGENVANFRKAGQAAKYVAFMRGDRNAK